jgi:ribosomal protein S12 methylthiotransferase accessory factor YcaO
MANQESIARWVLNNKRVLNPSLVQYDWPSRYLNGVYDFSVSVAVDGVEGLGRGLDRDRDLALEKACAEAIERYVCHRLGIDSIGVAVSGESDAGTHAELETLERYYFDQHQKHRRPFVKLRDGSDEANQFKKTSGRI